MIGLAAVIAASAALGVRLGVRADPLARRLLWAMLWIALPVVAFFNIAALELTAEVGAGIGFAYAGIVAALGLAWAVGTWLLRLPRPAVGALMVVAAFGNTGYLGLPVSAALFGLDEVPNAVAFDIVVTGTAVITIGFSIGAAFGTVARDARGRIRAFLVRNPPLWATLAGLVAPEALAPGWAVDASQVLAVSLLLPGFFAVGVTLASLPGGALALTRPVAWALAIKLTVPLAVMAALAAAFVDVPDSYLSQSAMASALAALLIANEYGLDRGIAAGAIGWSTALVVAAGIVASPGFG